MALYFQEDDKMELIDAVTPLQAVEYLGIETQRRGQNISILCPAPEHNDRHFGSCMIEHHGRTCKCYACGRRLTSLSILMLAGGYTLYDAMCILAEISGMSDKFEASKKENQKRIHQKSKTVPLQTRRMLNLSTNSHIKAVLNAVQTRPESGNCIRDNNGDYVILNSVLWNPWTELCQQEPETADWLIRNKCEEKMLQLDYLIHQLKNPMSTKISEMFYEIRQIYGFSLTEAIAFYQRQYQEIENIYVEHGGTLSDAETIANKIYMLNRTLA